VDTNRAEEYNIENIENSVTYSLGYYELEQHKPWYDEECSRLLSEEASV